MINRGEAGTENHSNFFYHISKCKLGLKIDTPNKYLSFDLALLFRSTRGFCPSYLLGLDTMACQEHNTS